MNKKTMVGIILIIIVVVSIVSAFFSVLIIRNNTYKANKAKIFEGEYVNKQLITPSDDYKIENICLEIKTISKEEYKKNINKANTFRFNWYRDKTYFYKIDVRIKFSEFDDYITMNVDYFNRLYGDTYDLILSFENSIYSCKIETYLRFVFLKHKEYNYVLKSIQLNEAKLMITNNNQTNNTNEYMFDVELFLNA